MPPRSGSGLVRQTEWRTAGFGGDEFRCVRDGGRESSLSAEPHGPQNRGRDTSGANVSDGDTPASLLRLPPLLRLGKQHAHPREMGIDSPARSRKMGSEVVRWDLARGLDG